MLELAAPFDPVQAGPSLCAPQYAIRGITADGKIRGYIAIWGTAAQRDCYGTWFDRAKPPALGLEFLPIPLFYEHGLDPQIGKTPIGRVDKAWVDDTGIGFEGQLEAGPYRDKVAAEVRGGKLATSSGTAMHLADFDQEGRFKKWYLSELSLTSNPCEPRMPNVMLRSNNGSAFRSAIFAQDDPQRGHSGECSDCDDPQSNEELTPIQGDLMNISKEQAAAIRQLVGAVNADPAQLAAPVDEQTAASIQALVDQFGGIEALMMYLESMAPDPMAEMSADPARTDDPVATPATAAQPVTVTAGSATVTVTEAARTGTGGSEVRSAADLEARLAQLERRLVAPPAAPAPAYRARQPQSFNIVSEEYSAYDHLEFEDMVAAAQWFHAGVRSGKMARVSDRFNRALVARARDMLTRQDDQGRATMRSLVRPGAGDSRLIQRQIQAIRSNELMGSTVAGAGDEWVGVLYDTRLWEKVRQGTIYQALVGKGLAERTVPQGQESIVVLTEGADPTWYGVAQTTDESSNIIQPKAASSKPGTGNTTLTVSKIGAVVVITTEYEEDSLIGVIPQLRSMMDISGQEAIENLLINGDTATGANTNINLIDATPTAGTLYLQLDGFLKLCLVTNTANSRSSGAALAAADYLETLKLMGTLGRDAIERERCVFIVDNSSYYATLALTEVKTNDVFTNGATLQNGEIQSMWGRQIYVSGQMGLAYTAGKISTTGSNNTKGRILAVRPDRWTIGWKRRATTEVQRYARADATEIVTFMRLGLKPFSNEASAVTYNLTV